MCRPHVNRHKRQKARITSSLFQSQTLVAVEPTVTKYDKFTTSLW